MYLCAASQLDTSKLDGLNDLFKKLDTDSPWDLLNDQRLIPFAFWGRWFEDGRGDQASNKLGQRVIMGSRKCMRVR